MIPSSNSNTAVVTGGSSGIGFEIAKILKTEGFETVITGQEIERLNAVSKDLGAQAHRLRLNDQRSIDEFVRILGGRPVTVFVANAGSIEPAEAEQSAQTAGSLDLLERACGLLSPGGVLVTVNTTFTEYSDSDIPPQFLPYVEGKRALLTRAAELSDRYPRIRVIDAALNFVDGTRCLERIMGATEAAAYRDYMAGISGGTLTTAAEAAAFIVEQCRRPEGRVRVRIDRSVLNLSLPTHENPVAHT